VAHIEPQAAGGPLDPTWRVTLNFHPDRATAGVPILRAMAEAGTYRSQFETGTSNGGLTAHPGGDRWRWEQRIFGGAYDDAPAAERPKYGALNHRCSPFGGAPRFGSAHLRLAAHTLERTTFCYPDSVFEPEHLGTAVSCALTTLADDDLASGVTDDLDGYVEAHVHGVLDLGRDVEALVLDAAYRGTSVEEDARELPCPVEWHDGFRLDLDTVRSHPDYRGPEIVEVAEQVAVDGRLDPVVIGHAVAAGRHDPQDLKRVWHHVARFGAPVT
jgi:hypothetical protein